MWPSCRFTIEYVVVSPRPVPVDFGLEYVFSKDGYWVRFHPSQYQESKSSQLKDYSVTNDVVKGTDEDGGELTNGKYERSVKFEAKINN